MENRTASTRKQPSLEDAAPDAKESCPTWPAVSILGPSRSSMRPAPAHPPTHPPTHYGRAGQIHHPHAAPHHRHRGVHGHRPGHGPLGPNLDLHHLRPRHEALRLLHPGDGAAVESSPPG